MLVEIIIAASTVIFVLAVTFVVIKFSKYTKARHKQGVIVIPVTDETEAVDYAVKSAYFDETFDNTLCGREILIVDFGCTPQMWEHYQKLASKYDIVHAINCHELRAYIKAKFVEQPGM